MQDVHLRRITRLRSRDTRCSAPIDAGAGHEAMTLTFIDVFDIARRGNEAPESLSELEKDLYWLFEFQTIYEMEGFAHFFITDRHVQLPRIVAFMERVQAPNAGSIRRVVDLVESRVGGWDLDKVAGVMLAGGGEDETIDAASEEYYSQVEVMWGCVDAYLRTHHGVTLEPEQPRNGA